MISGGLTNTFRTIVVKASTVTKSVELSSKWIGLELTLDSLRSAITAARSSNVPKFLELGDLLSYEAFKPSSGPSF